MERRILRASPYYWEKVVGKHLAQRHRKGRLSFLLLNQPPLCDCHCRRCFMPSERREHNKQDALTTEKWKHILGEGQKLGVLSIEISGEGEPLLSESTLPIIEYAASLGMLSTLITNGHNLSENSAGRLEQASATLVFSLHTLDRRKYEKDNRLDGSFIKKMEAIEAAAKIFSGTDYFENGYHVFRLAVHATLQADTLDEVENLKSFCHKRNMFFSIAPLAYTGNAVHHPELLVEQPIEEVTSLGDNSIIHSETSKGLYGREVCGTAAFGMSIGFDGNLLLDAHGGYEIGPALANVKTDSLHIAYHAWRNIVPRIFQETSGFCPVRDVEDFRKLIAGLV